MTNQNSSETTDLGLVPVNTEAGGKVKYEYDGGFSLLEPKDSALTAAEQFLRPGAGKRDDFQEFTFG